MVLRVAVPIDSEYGTLCTPGASGSEGFVLEEVKNKDGTLRGYNVSPIKKMALNLTSAYMSIIQWISQRMNLQADKAKEEVRKFVMRHSGQI